MAQADCSKCIAKVLKEADFCVRTFVKVNTVYEAYLAVVVGEHKRVRADAFAEETDAVEDASARHTRAGEDNFLAGSQFVSLVDSFWVFHAHFGQAFFLFRFRDDQPRSDFSVQTLQRCRGQHALGRTADSHHGMDART